MLIVNDHAGAVSARTKQVIAKALSADFKLEEAVTAARRHASELAADAADRGFDAVVTFGGDGTINEAAQGLAGTEVALGFLPGGTTNVMARSLGMPLEPVEATAYLADRIRSRSCRRINLGRIDDRYFLFSAGMGLDAEVVKRTEEHPESKRKWGQWTFVSHAVRAAMSRYRAAEPGITMTVDGGGPERVLLAVCCNARPLTYLGRWPVDVCPLARLDLGLDVLAFTKIRSITVPRVAWGVFVSRSQPTWRIARYHHDLRAISLQADDPLPVQADGDYLGDWNSAEIKSVPEALDLLV
jgi:diacylglycerol kinase family enzyme